MNMNDKEKLNMLAMRALEEVQLGLDDFSCTLMMILQEKLESPEADVRNALKMSFEAEEPLAWDGLTIPELGVIVLNDRCNKQLHFVDRESGDKLLVLKKEELKDE